MHETAILPPMPGVITTWYVECLLIGCDWSVEKLTEAEAREAGNYHVASS